MKECHFCQNPVDDKKTFSLLNPNGEQYHMCDDCANDMMLYFQSGEAEEKRETLAARLKQKQQQDGFAKDADDIVKLSNSIWGTTAKQYLAPPALTKKKVILTADGVTINNF